jgi:hypothetical protein
VIAMLKTSPLVVTLGLSLTIPCAIVGDVFEGTPLGGWKTGLGAVLVVLGFIGAFILVAALELTGGSCWDDGSKRRPTDAHGGRTASVEVRKGSRR